MNKERDLRIDRLMGSVVEGKKRIPKIQHNIVQEKHKNREDQNDVNFSKIEKKIEITRGVRTEKNRRNCTASCAG